jgi:hypothetical protein
MGLDKCATVKDRAQDTYKAVQEICNTLGLRILSQPLVVAKYLVEQGVMDARHAEILSNELKDDHDKLRSHILNVCHFQQVHEAASG